MRIAIIQSDVFFGDSKRNYANMSTKICNAMKENPDIILLPELWNTGYDLINSNYLADINCVLAKNYFSSLATKYCVNIIGGSVLKKSEIGITNTLLCFDRSGECISEYDKVHLFKLMNEHKYLKPGSNLNIFDLENVKSAGLICYDIRFPEWIRAHTVQGAKVIYLVAEWPIERVSHWKALLTCRAIENQCYVVACNRSGKDQNNQFAGNSMIIDPWGEIIVEAGPEPVIIFADIDLSKVDKIRKEIPIFQDRRVDLY